MKRSAPEILVFVPAPGDAERYRSLIRDRYPQARIHTAATPEEAEGVIPDTEILFGWMVPPALLEKARRLRWMQKTGAGVEDVLVSGLPDTVTLTRSDGSLLAPRMIEYVLGAVYAHTQKFDRARQQQAGHLWDYFMVDRASGKTLAIAGLGDIGRRLAERAAANEFRVLGWRRTARAVPRVEMVYSGRAGFLEMLAVSDFVVAVLPHTPETEGIFDAEAFAAMPKGGFFINIGRGGAVDEAALVEALDCGHLSGAALDVFREEPLPPGSPLWTAKNLRITPHVSGPIIADDVVPFFLDNLDRYLQGQPLKRVVDRSSGY